MIPKRVIRPREVKKPSVVTLAKNKRKFAKTENRNKRKINILEQIKIEKLILDSKKDKKRIAELEKQLKELQKRYNELDDDSVPRYKY